MSTLLEECFSRKILIGGCPLGMTVGTQARWLVRMAVNNAGRNLEYQTWLVSTEWRRIKKKKSLAGCILLTHKRLFPAWPHLVRSDVLTQNRKDVFLLNWISCTHLHCLQYTYTYMHIERKDRHTDTNSISMIHFSVLTTSVYFPSCLMTQHCWVHSHDRTKMCGSHRNHQSWEYWLAIRIAMMR